MYENLVFNFPQVVDEKTDFTISPHPLFRGAADVGGSEFTAIYETITQPTIIRIPAGVWYCPLNFRVVNKPVMVEAFLMQPEFTANYYSLSRMHKMRYIEPGKWEEITE